VIKERERPQSARCVEKPSAGTRGASGVRNPKGKILHRASAALGKEPEKVVFQLN